MTSKRDRWAQYYCVAQTLGYAHMSPDNVADSMIEREEERFGAFPSDDGKHAELARANASVLEQETRAQNAERALEQLQDEVVTLRHVVADVTVERDTLQAWADDIGDQGAAVPVAELRGVVEYAQRCAAAHRAVPNEGEALNYEDIAGQLLRAITAAEQRAAKPAEGGETGEG